MPSDRGRDPVFAASPSSLSLQSRPDGLQSGVVEIGPLELCPFCGAPARVEWNGEEADMIWCGGNACHLQPILWFCNFDSIEETVAAWNRRPQHTEAKIARVDEKTETVTIPREAYDFLMGLAPLEGVWFGELHEGLPGAFWWRGVLASAAGWPEPRPKADAA